MAEAALRYAQLGLPVFPLQPQGKVPLGECLQQERYRSRKKGSVRLEEGWDGGTPPPELPTLPILCLIRWPVKNSHWFAC